MTATEHAAGTKAKGPKILPDRRIVPKARKPVDLTDLALAVFGTDAAGKPHAARFGRADADLARRAAAKMGYRVLPVATDAHRALAARLPAGRVFGSGSILAPLIKPRTFAELSASEGVETPPAPVAAGENVQAPGAPGPVSTGAAADGGQAFNLPLDWETITVRALVLARDDDPSVEGWFEAAVIEDRGENVLVLAWRGYPDLPIFVRRREHLALLPAGHATAAA